MTDSTLLVDGIDPLVLRIRPDNLWCMLCRRQFKSESLLDAHMQSAQHEEKAAVARSCGRLRPPPTVLEQALETARRWRLAYLGVQRKLATSQDAWSVHRCLAVAALANFMQKASTLISDGAFRPADAWLALHLLLALSSLRFRIPRTGGAVNQGYITAEVRGHTIAFSARQVALVLALQPHSANAPAPSPGFAAFVCLPFHLAVDLCTRLFGSSGFSAIRGRHDQLSSREGVDRALRHALSTLQFAANHATLHAGRRGAEVAFVMLATIQINAFLMTLRRKQLLGPFGLLYAYSALLGLTSAAALGLTASPAASLRAGVAMYIVRAWFGCPKYLLWACVVLASSTSSETAAGLGWVREACGRLWECASVLRFTETFSQIT